MYGRSMKNEEKKESFEGCIMKVRTMKDVDEG